MRQSVVHGLAQLKAKLNMLGDESVETKTFIFFVGSTVPATGDSWCPDCIKAEPVVEDAVANIDTIELDQAAFIVCNVGLRDEWKNPANQIKMDASFGVKSIPTLIEYSLANSHFIEGRVLEREEDFKDVATVMSFLIRTGS